MDAIAINEDRPRLGGHVRLYTGGTVWPMDPRPGDELVVNHDDAAHMLSGEPRFCSATHEPYSVGQHSVNVSLVVSHRLGLITAANWHGALATQIEIVLAALLHDLPEIVLKDLPGPWKKHVWVDAPGGGVRRYSELEEAWVALLFPRFGLAPALASHPLIKNVDKAMCATEKRDLYRQDEAIRKSFWHGRSAIEARDQAGGAAWHVDQAGQEISVDEMAACSRTGRIEPWLYWTTLVEFRSRLAAITWRLEDARRQALVSK